MKPDDETAVSEVTIQPDGRVFVLGASRQLLEILENLRPEDAALKRRLHRAVSLEDCAKLEEKTKLSVSAAKAFQEKHES